eukprot:8488418-Pyramimonas_sp.AAC.1
MKAYFGTHENREPTDGLVNALESFAFNWKRAHRTVERQPKARSHAGPQNRSPSAPRVVPAHNRRGIGELAPLRMDMRAPTHSTHLLLPGH